MSLLQPTAQQFVVVGAPLYDELNQQELFKKYFQNKQDKIKFLESVDHFNSSDYPDLNRTLFIVKHFDIDPSSDYKRLDGDSIAQPQPNNNNNNNNNNNDIQNPAVAKLCEESEVESLGYTTDNDDIEDEHMQVDTTCKVAKFDYDGGYNFKFLLSKKCCVMGPIALLQTIRQLEGKEDDPIRMISCERPLHNLAMQNKLITFSGISTKQEAQQLLTLTRYMGAKSREDVTSKTTHLVAGNPRGLKYRSALEFGLSIMSTAWVYESFRLAYNDVDFEAYMPEIIQHYKLKPFHSLCMAFLGFREDDVKELSELTRANEGQVVDAADASCTHIVVDAISGSDDTSGKLLGSINQTSNAHIVYKEWFWASLELEGKAREDRYAVPGSKAQIRRSSRARRLSTGHNSFNNVLSPMLDYSRSPENVSCLLERQASRSHSVSCIAEDQPDLTKITARHRACLELLQTERNYVKILETIVTLFKVPLENPESQDPILPMTDVKIIFGNLTPIYDVHKRMLSELEALIETDWKETNCIGKVFVNHSNDLLKAYPPFVNFFEDTKKTINACDTKYPRFHAFLKRCQSRIECNRESLTEMLIRPVQRLPSISLIITELIKRTDDSNADKKYLNEAHESIRQWLNLINEDKRKTEGQIAMFDIVNNIEDCPPNLLSALRSFICKVEARLLFMNSESEVIPSKSHKVVIFLFSDLIEICKVRSLKRSLSSKGNRTYVPARRGLNPTQSAKVSNKKELRHLDELRLRDILNFYKNCQSPEMSDAIVLEARPSAKYDDFRYYIFVIDDETTSKATFVEKLDDCLMNCDDPEQVSEYCRNRIAGIIPNEIPPISNEKIDFAFANLLVNSMEKSRLSRVLSIRQSLLSPSLKSQRNLHSNNHH